MQTFYYSLMRKFLACLLPAFVAASLSAQNKDATQGAGDSSAAMHEKIKDSHEGVTIGLDPWTEASEYKEKFPKKSPFSKGVVAIHVSFRNDNDHALKVNYQSIRLLVQLGEENRQELASLSAGRGCGHGDVEKQREGSNRQTYSIADTDTEHWSEVRARFELDGAAGRLPECWNADHRGGRAQYGGRTDLF